MVDTKVQICARPHLQLKTSLKKIDEEVNDNENGIYNVR